MLLDTKRGKPNKIQLDPLTENAQGPHIWDAKEGYIAVPYRHQMYPLTLYRPKVEATNEIADALDEILKAPPKERDEVYLSTITQIGEMGYDVRQFPLVTPSDAVLKSLKKLLILHVAAAERDEWLKQNPAKTAKDFAAFKEAPETVTVESASEHRALEGKWFRTPECKEEVPPPAEEAPPMARRRSA